MLRRQEAKLATFVFSLGAPFLIVRALTFGVLMINRRTMLISWSTLALAAFGVVHGLTSLLMSPMRNLLHTAQTLARTTADRTALRRFAVQVGGVLDGARPRLRYRVVDAGAMGVEDGVPENRAWALVGSRTASRWRSWCGGVGGRCSGGRRRAGP